MKVVHPPSIADDEDCSSLSSGADLDALKTEINEFESRVTGFVERYIHEGMDRGEFNEIMTKMNCKYSELYDFVPNKKHPSYSEFTRLYRDGMKSARSKCNLFPLYREENDNDSGSNESTC